MHPLILLGAGALVLLIWYVVLALRQSWIHRDADYISGWIKPPVTVKGCELADERLPRLAAQRRQHAESKQLEAAQIASGDVHESKVIRIVR